MTIRGKVLLLLVVALGLVGGLGAALYQGAQRGRLLRDWGAGSQEQRFLYSELRGDALVFLGDLQRVHGSGALPEAVLNGYRRKLDRQLARIEALAKEELAWEGSDNAQELRQLTRLSEVMRDWADRAAERVQQLPSGIGSDGAHPQISMQEFYKEVEPLLLAALELEQMDVEALVQLSEQGLRRGELLAVSAPVAALSVLLGLALAILVPMNRRLQEMLVAAQRIGRGDFQTVLPETNRDELCCLARGFNQMAQELRTSHARLMQSDRLVSLGRTVASVGHEINNPLAYVISNLSYVHGELSDTEGRLPDAQLRELLAALDEAREGAERVRFIAQDLKTLARTDDGRRSHVNVSAVVRDVGRMACHALQGRARLVEDCEGVPPVCSNVTRLGQVFLNLIVNGAQAIAPGDPEHNEIRVTARLAEPGCILVDVSDTGCGIPPENLERIFDPFFTTKPEGEGTGLGLAVCLNIVRSLGGSITVDSTPGKGTTFHVLLPTATEDVVQASAPAP